MSFASALARRHGGWCVLVKIEGLGTNAGQYVWCSSRPAYAASSDLYLPDLATWPDPLEEDASAMGGVAKAGAVSVELVDTRNTITGLARFDRAPATVTSDDLATTDTDITFDAAALPADLASANGVVWIGNEAIAYATTSATELLTCTRGWLGTSAQSHAAGSQIYSSSPYLKTRLLSLYLIAADAASGAEAYLLGEYRIDRLSLAAKLNKWRIGGSTSTRYLSRTIAGRTAGSLRVAAIAQDGRALWTGPSGTGGSIAREQARAFSDETMWPDRIAWVQRGDEEPIRGRGYGSWVLLNERHPEIEIGDTVRQVWSSDEAFGAFRFSPGPTPSVSRSSGTWTLSAHWVDQILALLTSSAHPDDGLELVNHAGSTGLYSDAGLPDQARSNWSSLPVGVGIGVPANLIDLESFVAIRRRTVYRFPRLAVGNDQIPFARFADDAWLLAVGAFLATSDGKLALIYPRLPTLGETGAASWGTDEILEVSGVELDLSMSGIVRYLIPRADGSGDDKITFAAADFFQNYGQRGHYARDDQPIEIRVSGARADPSGIDAPLSLFAARRLLRFSRPHWRLSVSTGMEQYAVRVGDLVTVSHPDLPELLTGSRGWTSVVCQVVKRAVRVGARGPVIDWSLIAYGPGQSAGRVAQAAVVTGSSLSGSNRIVTLAANRYTSPDSLGGLPTTDAACFAVNDVVQEYTRALVSVGSSRTVVSVGSNQITISGTGAPTTGNLICTEVYASQAAAQKAQYVSLADATNGEVSSGVPGYRYGEL